jgi:hypothetical protein
MGTSYSHRICAGTGPGTIVAALGLVPAIKDRLESEAEKLPNDWLTKQKTITHVAVEGLRAPEFNRDLGTNLGTPINSL